MSQMLAQVLQRPALDVFGENFDRFARFENPHGRLARWSDSAAGVNLHAKPSAGDDAAKRWLWLIGEQDRRSALRPSGAQSND